mgnify:CR=1 FL=1
MIEPGALSKAACKMIKMTTGKGKSNGRDDQPLDTTGMKSISADQSPESTGDRERLERRQLRLTQASFLAPRP